MSLSPIEKHILKRAMKKSTKKSMRKMIFNSGLYAQISLNAAFVECYNKKESLNNFVKVASVN